MSKYGVLSRVRTDDPHPVKMVLSLLSYQDSLIVAVSLCFAATKVIISGCEEEVNVFFETKKTGRLFIRPARFQDVQMS